MRVSRCLLVLSVAALLGAGCGSDDAPTVALVSPAEGAKVSGGVEVAMAAEGTTIEEAGDARNGAGHFHMIADDGCTTPGSDISKDADHVHFG